MKRITIRMKLWNAIALLVALVAIPVSVFLVYQGVQLFTSAAANPVSVFFSPDPYTAGSAGGLRMNIDTRGSQVGYVRAELLFDNTRLQLASDIATASALSQVIFKTPYTQANQTGQVLLILGVSPEQVNQAPSGVFEIARLSFNQIGQPTGTTSVSLATPAEAIDMNATSLTVEFTPASVLFAQAATSAPTTAPTSAPSATAVPTVAPTIAPTPGPVSEVVTIQKAAITSYFRRFYRITIEARSSFAPNVKLNATGFGELKYNARKKIYTRTFWTSVKPTFVTVTSTGGSSATATVK